MTPTLVSLLGELVDAAVLSPPLARGEGVKRSDVVEHMLVPLVRQWYRYGTLPRLREPLTSAELEQLQEALPTPAEIVARVDLARRVIAEAERVADGRGFRLRPTMVGEWVATRVGAGETDVAGLASDAVTHAQWRAGCLGEREFADRFAGPYDDRWRSHGAGNLAQRPPSQLFLGADERPPLLDRRDERPAQATDSSVYHRYRLVFSAAARDRSPHTCPRPACHDLPPRTDDPAAAEVVRVCEPYGLAEPTHHVVLRSAMAGYEQGIEADPPAGSARRQWKEWVAECPPVATAQGTDPAVVEAVASAAATFGRTGLAWALRQEFGDTALTEAQTVASFMRRLWRELHRHERQHAGAVRRCRVAAAVAASLRFGIGEEARDYLSPAMLTPVRVGQPLPAREVRRGLVDGRYADVLARMDEDVVRDLLHGHEGWQQAYLAAAADLGPDADPPSPDEMRDYLLHQLGPKEDAR